MRKSLPGLVATALAVAVAATPAHAAEGRVLHAGGTAAVPGSYVVKLDDPSAAVPGLAARYGGRVDRVFSGAFHGFSARLTDRQARRLAADPAVAYVEQDQVVRANATQFNAPWHLDRLDQRATPLDGAYGHTSTGRGTRAYVIDTGIRTTHREFAGRTCAGWDFIGGDSSAEDDNGHGTHVAGLIGGATHGVAKEVLLCPVKVLNASGSGTTAGVIAGIDWVAAHHVKPAVANFSLGGAASTAVDDAVRRLIAAGVSASVTAGGSGGDAAAYSPARVVEAVTSGASTAADLRAGFSNHGSVVDVYAPGQAIVSAWHTSDTATATLSGTSMATAQVTGVANRYLQTAPAATPAQVQAAIAARATPLSWGRLLHWPADR